jgi:hypothetical protein
MQGDTFLLTQLIGSMEDAINKLEIAKNQGNIQDFNKLSSFILDLQKKIEIETENL